MKHKCPVPGCRSMVQRTMAMCFTHWRMVPSNIQSKIWTTWRASDWQAHAEAMKLAMAAIKEKG
ncbi:MAG TPA: hypothetical protein VIW07_13060 [Candidatus Udaeobacter sp.]